MSSTYEACGCVYRSGVGLERACEQHSNALTIDEAIEKLFKARKKLGGDAVLENVCGMTIQDGYVEILIR